MASHQPNDDRQLQPVWRAQPYQRPFVEAFYLEKASREGRMLTLGGKLRDFFERAATDCKKSRGRCEQSVAAVEF
jgi:hypothetical protein